MRIIGGLKMTICDNCIHDEVCGLEGHLDEALTFCANKATGVQPIRRGRWITSHPVDIAKEFKCTACGGLIELPVFAKKCYYDFCPNCNADMRDVPDTEVDVASIRMNRGDM